MTMLDHFEQQIEWLKYHQPTIEEALAYGGNTATFDDVVARVLAGNAELHADEDSFIITEIIKMPRVRYLHVWLNGGEMDAVLSREDELMVRAHELGCTHLSGSGRIGWMRVMEKQGWDFLTMTVSKEVPYGQRRH